MVALRENVKSIGDASQLGVDRLRCDVQDTVVPDGCKLYDWSDSKYKLFKALG